MLNKFLALALLCPLVSNASDSWTDGQKQLGTALFVATSVDWLQTRNIANSPEKWHETNPLIGKHPSTAKVDGYFLSSVLLGALVLDSLPSEYRTIALQAGVVLELGVVANNARLGIGMKF